MWMPAETVAPPANPWLSVELARTYLAADDDDGQDAIIAGMIEAAGGHVEAYTGLRLLTQTVRLRCASFADLDRLPIAPVAQITSVEYLATDGTAQTLPNEDWEKFGFGLAVGIRPRFGATWPRTRPVDDAITVTAQVGYGAEGTAMPAAVRQACFLLLGDFYMNREDTAADTRTAVPTMPNGFVSLLSNYRLY